MTEEGKLTAYQKSPQPQVPESWPRRLNLGCGQFPLEGYLNVDVDPQAKADLFLDLNQLKNFGRFPKNHFEVIVMDHCLEHMDDVFETLHRLHGMLVPGGVLDIRVPHFSRGITHPQHRHGFDVTFPEYMNPRFHGGYIGVPFELESMTFSYIIRWDLKASVVRGWQIFLLKPLNVILSWLANRGPYVCSRFWCYWVGGFEQIQFIFKKPRGTL